MSKDVRGRRWMLTVPAEGEKGLARDELEAALEPYASYLGQMEKGESGYLHWQVLVVHDEPIRFSTLHRKMPTAHLEQARDLAKCIAYVQKAATRVEDEPPLMRGVIDRGPGQGHRTDLDSLRARILDGQETVDDLLMGDVTAWRHGRMTADLVAARDRARLGAGTRNVQVRVIFGDTGTGKTRAALDGLRRLGTVCRVTHWGPGAFDAYDGQDSIIFDEFTGQPPLSELLTWLDVYPVDLPARYRARPAAFERVVICTNVAGPWNWYPHAPKVQRAALARRLDVVEEWSGTWDNVTVTNWDKAQVLEKMTADVNIANGGM